MFRTNSTHNVVVPLQSGQAAPPLCLPSFDSTVARFTPLSGSIPVPHSAG